MTSKDFQTFLEKYPAYKQTESIDVLRKKDYARLDDAEHIYLDYTGGGICRVADPAASENFALIMSSATRIRPTPLRSRLRILLKARANTSSNSSTPTPTNISPFSHPMPAARSNSLASRIPSRNGRYLLTFDNHNSVNGIREFAHVRGAR